MEKEKNDKVELIRLQRKEALTEEQRIKCNKMIAIPCMCLVCALVLWLIFKPVGIRGWERQQGIQHGNARCGEKTDVEADKRKAYSQGGFCQQTKGKRQSQWTPWGVYAKAWTHGIHGRKRTLTDAVWAAANKSGKTGRRMPSASSAEAYQTLNTTLGGFYEQPQQGEAAKMLSWGNVLTSWRQAWCSRKTSVPIWTSKSPLWRSPINFGKVHAWWKCQCGKSFISRNCNRGHKKGSCHQGQESQGFPVRQSAKACSLVLNRPMSNGSLQPLTGKGFGKVQYRHRKRWYFRQNTISACIHGNQTITDGQAVRLRLFRERREIQETLLLSGAARLQGERILHSLKSIEHNGMIIPIGCSQWQWRSGGHLHPGSRWRLTHQGSRCQHGKLAEQQHQHFSPMPGHNLPPTWERCRIQGVSQYISKKMRTVKIHLKDMATWSMIPRGRVQMKVKQHLYHLIKSLIKSKLKWRRQQIFAMMMGFALQSYKTRKKRMKLKDWSKYKMLEFRQQQNKQWP